MLKHLKILFLLLLLTLCGLPLYARLQEQAKIDSLLKELPQQRDDSNKVKLLLEIGTYFINFSVSDTTGLECSKQCLALAEKIKWTKGIADGHSVLGTLYWRKGLYREALTHHFAALPLYRTMGDKMQTAHTYTSIAHDYFVAANYRESLKDLALALEIYKSIGSKKGMAYVYSSNAWAYDKMGNYPEAAKNDYASMRVEEELGNKTNMAIAYLNVGSICERQGNDTGAIRHYRLGIKMLEELKDRLTLSAAYNELGNIYEKKAIYDEALKNHFIALQLDKENNNQGRVAISLRYIGSAYTDMGNYTEALHHFSLAEQIFINDTNRQELSTLYCQMGTCYTKLNNYKEAKKVFDKALALSKDLKTLRSNMDYYQSIVIYDSATANWKEAFLMQRQYTFINDSLASKDNIKKIMQTQMQYDFDKKEAATQALQDKKNIQQRNVRNSIMAGMAGLLVFTIVVYRQRNKVKKEKTKVEAEKARSEELLLNILPHEVANELKAKGTTTAKHYDHVTVLFTDFVNFTQASEKMGAQGLIDELHTCFKAFDEITSKHNIEKIKTIGDAYLAVCGLPTPDPKHAENIVKAALEINAFMADRLTKMGDGRAFRIRIGIHTGSVVAGIVGVKKFAYDIWGDTVNTAARMEQNSEAGKINISETTYELVKDKFSCEYRGEVEVKGKGVMKMYFVS